MTMMNNQDEKLSRDEIPVKTKLNMFVEAGAGAGKTYLIVQRITNMLREGIDPSRIVVITFTNAAAEELRGRITLAVQKAGLKEAFSHLDEMNISTIHSFCNVLLKEQATVAGLPLDLTIIDDKEEIRQKNKYFNKYLGSLSGAEWERLENYCDTDNPRSTIRNRMYSLYNGIFKQPEKVRIVRKDSAELDKEKAILEKANSDTNDEDRMARVESIKEKILEVANSLIKSKEKKLSSFKELFPDKVSTDKASTEENSKDKESKDEPTTDFRLTAGKFEKWSFLFNETDYSLAEDLFLEWALADKITLFVKSKMTKDYYKENTEQANGELKDFVDKAYCEYKVFANGQKKAGDFLKGLQTDVLYSELLLHAIEAVKLCKKSMPAGLVTNDRLLELATNLICNEKDDRALKYFSSKYSCFYVDEFQDTDSLQADFIYRLASDLSDPTHTKLRDGALFVVGDPKQSIYRFRGAQPEVYFEIKDRMAGLDNAAVYELQWNFRTNNKLIDWINEKFEEADGLTKGQTLTADASNIMYIVDKAHPYMPMVPQKMVATGSDKLLFGAYRYQVCDSFTNNPAFVDDENIKKKDKVSKYLSPEYSSEKDVRDVVNLIRNLIDGDYYITDYDENRNPYARRIKASDILLMTHKKGNMKKYLTELKKCGVSVKLDGKASLTEDVYINTFVRIYKHLINPRDRFGGMAAREAVRMTKLTDSERSMDLYSDYLLDSLREGAKGMSPYGVAEYLEKQLSALLHKDEKISFIDANTSLARVRQMLEYIYQNEHGNGVSIIDAMEEYINDGVEHELSLERESDSTIRLMNLHKTKGLEGKIVIIADRNNKLWQKKMTDYRKGDCYYPGMKIGNGSWNVAERDKNLEDSFLSEEKAEFHRLEYVAVTRAEQAVIFMNTVKPGCIFANREVKGDDLTEGFDYRLRELPSIDFVINLKDNLPKEPDRNDYDVKKCDDYTNIIENEDREDQRLKPVYEKISPSLLEVKDSQRVIKHRIIKEAEDKGVTKESQLSTVMKRPMDNNVGNVLHRAMELLVGRFDAYADKTAVDRTAKAAVNQALHENLEDISHSKAYTVDEVKDFVTECAKSYYNFLLSDSYGLLDGKKRVYTELPFSYYDEASEEERTFMKGNADLIITRNDGSAVLIDYKSDNDNFIPEDKVEAVFSEKYSPQLVVYKKIIHRLLKVPEDKISAYIISFTQKDMDGRLYEDKTVRVRCTQIRLEGQGPEQEGVSNTEVDAEGINFETFAGKLENKLVLREFVRRCEAHPEKISDDLLEQMQTTEFGGKHFSLGRKNPMLVDITGKSPEEVKVLRRKPSRYYSQNDLTLHIHGKEFLVNSEWYNNERLKNLLKLIDWMYEIFENR